MKKTCGDTATASGRPCGKVPSPHLNTGKCLSHMTREEQAEYQENLEIYYQEVLPQDFHDWHAEAMAGLTTRSYFYHGAEFKAPGARWR